VCVLPQHSHVNITHCCCCWWCRQDLLLAFVDCVERNGAKLAIPRTVLELDPSMDAEAILGGMGPRMSAVGLLPAPGGVYGPRGGPNMPITVQVGGEGLQCVLAQHLQQLFELYGPQCKWVDCVSLCAAVHEGSLVVLLYWFVCGIQA
jgi:hypothetical protein